MQPEEIDDRTDERTDDPTDDPTDDAVEDLSTALLAAAAQLLARGTIRDTGDTLAGILESAVTTVPGVDGAGLSVTRDGRLETRAPTTLGVRRLDELQHSLHEGPCVDAVDGAGLGGVVVAADLAGPDASRWPRFAHRAVETGYRAILSTQLHAEKGVVAALNLYAGRPGTFDRRAQLTAALFGAQASLLLYGNEHAANLGRALRTRDLIGQAKGILMERFAVDGDEAFRMLTQSSQQTNVRLVDVARWLVGEADRRHQLRAARPTPN